MSQINKLIRELLAYRMTEYILTEMPKKYNVLSNQYIIKLRFSDIANIGAKFGLKPGQARWIFNHYVMKFMEYEGWELVESRHIRGKAHYIFRHSKRGANFLNPEGE